MFIIDNNMEVNLSSACRLHWKFTSSFINHLLHARHSAGCWDTKKSVPQTLPLWSRWVSGQNRLYVVMTDRTEDLDMVHRRGGAQRRPLGSECRGCTGSFRQAGKLLVNSGNDWSLGRQVKKEWGKRDHTTETACETNRAQTQDGIIFNTIGSNLTEN